MISTVWKKNLQEFLVKDYDLMSQAIHAGPRAEMNTETKRITQATHGAML